MTCARYTIGIAKGTTVDSYTVLAASGVSVEKILLQFREKYEKLNPEMAGAFMEMRLADPNHEADPEQEALLKTEVLPSSLL